MKRVSFAPTASEVNVTHYIGEGREKAEFWFQLADFHSFREESKSTLKALKLANFQILALDPQIHCLRGLEDRLSPRYYKQKRLQQIMVVRKIVAAQRTVCPELLREVSVMHTREARDKALEVAMIDAKAAGCHRRRRSMPDPTITKPPPPKRRRSS